MRLRTEGFEVAIRANHLVVSHVPYVNAQRRVALGALVSDLSLVGDRTTKPANHVAFFIGDQPCHADGREIEQIKHQAIATNLGGALVADRSFSNKPAGGYADYFEKMTTYIAIISGPAEATDPTVSAKTFRVADEDGVESAFNYTDTASTRAGIGAASERLSGHRVAIVGVGGTGSYLLDLLAKCPVSEIHLFDGDKFHQHTAFRSPGAASADQIDSIPFKVHFFADQYSRMHRGIVPHPYHIDQSNVAELKGFDFVFTSIDGGVDKEVIIRSLEAFETSFIDCGIGVDVVDDVELLGTVRITASTPSQRAHVKDRVPLGEAAVDGDYARNIQIADLNMLAASMAVIKWKKLSGFYQDLEGEHCSFYAINVNQLLSEDQACADPKP